MEPLEVNLLGAPEVRRAGSVCTPRTRKALALLAYLAAEGGLHPRAAIVDLLWPEADETRGRAVLRSTLHTLRESLGSEGADVLVAERDLLGLAADTLSLDLRTLEQARRLALAPASRADQPERLLTLAAAVERVHGPFLDGLTLPDAPDFEAWVTARRAHWHGIVSHLYAQLAAALAAAGEPDRALLTLERWVRHAPLDEAAHRALMDAHLAAADRDGALRAYEACRAVFAAELGATPSRETQALAARIAATRAARPHPPATAGALPEPPLVGRGRELQALRGAYREVEAGGARVVVVAGEAGIGKTRLATAFLSWAQVQGADVLTGRAFEAACGLPYAPLVMALRERLERENAPEDLLADVWLAELARLWPELRERYPDLPSVVGDAGEARARLFEAVARLLRGLAGRHPVVLVLDDAQWADGATRDLVRYLVQRGARARLLVVLALRAEDAALRPELIVWLAGLARDGAARRLDLAPLGPTDTLRLVAGLAEAGSCDAGCAARETGVSRLGAWIHTQTGGRPFVILEILRALVAEGALGLRADDRARYALDVPANWHAPAGTVGMMTVQLREVLGARLAQLDPLARQVLLVGALLGDSFTLEQVCQAAEVSEQAAVGALDLLARACLLEEDGTPGCYTLAYDMLRTVVRAQAGAARRQVMSRRMEAERVAAHTLSRPIARQGYPRHRHGGGLPGQASVPRCKVPNPVNLACAS